MITAFKDNLAAKRTFEFYRSYLEQHGMVLTHRCKYLFTVTVRGDISYAFSDIKEVGLFVSGVKASCKAFQIKEEV